MIDYARVAETLKKVMNGDYVNKAWGESPIKDAITAAAALCEAHAAPDQIVEPFWINISEQEAFDKWFRDHYDIPLIRNSRAEAAWLARARSDARAKVADWQPIESAPDDCTMVLVPIDESSTMAFYVKSDGVWKDCDGEVMEPQPNYFMYLPEAPAPPTVEGEQK